MKTTIFTFLMCCFLSFSNYSQTSSDQVKVGDTFTIGEVKMNNYEHIKFPRKNFIIKRGGIANLKSVYGKEVEVVDYAYTDEGDTI